MSWFYVDDGLNHSRKVALLPRHMRTRAIGLWTLAGSWAREQLTGGVVPLGQINLLGGTTHEASALVDAGFWVVIEGGYAFKNWSDWQETAEEVEHQRVQNRLRKQAWRKKKASKAQAMSPGMSHGVSTTVSPGMSHGDNQKNGVPKHTNVTRVVPGGVTHMVQGDPSPSPSPSDLSPPSSTNSSTRRSDRAGEAPAPLNGNAAASSGFRTDRGESESESERAEVEARELIQREYGARFAAKSGGIPPDWTDANVEWAIELAYWLLDHQGADVPAACARLLDGFFGDKWASEHGYPLADLAKRPMRYFGNGASTVGLKELAKAALQRGDMDEWRKLKAQIKAGHHAG